MNKISIKDVNNQIVEVFFVRYFKYKNTNYLIYTMNEKDEKGFIKLYLVKIMKQFNEWIAKTIKDEEEWKRMQLIVKSILKEIKNNNIKSFIDLDVQEIINIKIKEARYFKLDEKLMQILSLENTPVDIDNAQLEGLPSMEDIAPVKLQEYEEVKEEIKQNEELDYKSLYIELQKDNEELNETMSDMLLELAEYRSKYGEIKGK